MRIMDVGTETGIRGGVDPAVASLISALCSDETGVRERARVQLVKHGRDAVEPLRHLLKSPDRQVRWEAVKTLGEIKGERAVDALVLSLSDEKRDIRWIAAQGLIACGETTLIPLLEEVIAHADSEWVRDGVAHILRSLRDKPRYAVAMPVLDALNGATPSFDAPIVAYDILRSIKSDRWMGRDISRQ